MNMGDPRWSGRDATHLVFYMDDTVDLRLSSLPPGVDRGSWQRTQDAIRSLPEVTP